MSAEEYKAKGNASLQAKEFDAAIGHYTKAIELDGSNHVFFSNRSAAYLSKGDADGALKDAEKCIELNPTWPKGFSRLGAALHTMKKYDEAMEAYEKGLEVAPEDAALRNGLSEVMKAKSSTIRNPLAGAFGGDVMGKLAGHPKFSTYLRDPAFVKNVQLFQQTQNFQLVQTDPRMMEVLTFLLGIELPADEAGDDDASTPAHPAPQGSRTPQAAPAAKAEPTIDPNETKEEKAARENRAAALEAKKRGNEHYSQKEFDLASACYEEAIALDPANMTFISNKAAVAFEKGDLDGCIELCRAAVEVGRAHRADYADIAKAFVRMGKAAAKGGDLAAAIEFYKSAQVENYTKEVERIIKNTELDLRKKTAMEYIDPEKALEAKERGNEHFRSGKWTDAIAEYQEAVKRDPENAIYRNNLASALLKVADFNGAKAAVEKALHIDPKYVKAWAKKGDIELFMKEYHKAQESYKAGLAVEEGNQLCLEGLRKTAIKIREGHGGAVDQDRARHGMADPEIQAILADPMVNQALRDLSDPKQALKVMSDPIMSSKIEKLIAAGVVQTA